MIALRTLYARQVQTVLSLAVLSALAAAARPQAAPQRNQATLQLRVPLVLEDVVVLDRHNQPVRDLKAADFTITDNGRPVKLGGFEEHAAPRSAQPASAPNVPNLGINVFTNYTPVPPDTPLNILLLDALNTPITDQAHVRQQMLDYLRDQPAGQRMAIFVLSTRLYLLQGFTSDPVALKTAIESKAVHTSGSPLLQDPVGGDTSEGLYNSDFFQCPFCDAETAKEGKEESTVAVVTERVQRTLDAMDGLAHYLSGLPGHKNLIWFSAAFPLYILQDPTVTNPSASAAYFAPQVRRTDDLLSRSQVAVFPVDARGIFQNTATQASHGGPNPVQNLVRGSDLYLASESNFLEGTSQEHAALDEIARDTGGKAYYNTGDLKEAVESAIRFGSDYYTMSFTPPSGHRDGKYHKIHIRTIVSGLHLSYRRGYYADDPSKVSSDTKQFAASAMQDAMLHGAPQPSELLFDVRAIPAHSTTQKVTESSHPDATLMQPPYRKYALDMLLDIHRLWMTRTAEGDYQGKLELAVLVYSADGAVANAESRLANLRLPPDRYAGLLAHGLTAHASIDAPVKGTWFIRIGIRDPASNRVGAIEIPVASLQSRQAMILAGRRGHPK
jgi:VWFA-related protein